jgi:hypothetical protein
MLVGGLGGGRAIAAGADPAVSGPPSGATVAVTLPPADDDLLGEAAARIASELTAAGLSYRALDCPDPADCTDAASAARIWLSREDGIPTIQVVATLPSGLEARRHVRVPPATGGDDPAVLAVRAVELLRDIYLDVNRTAVIGPRVHQALDERSSPGPARSRFRVQDGRLFLGYGVLTGRHGLGPAPGPVLGMGIGFGGGFSIVASVTGAFSHRLGDAELGTVSSEQALAMMGGRYEHGTGRVRPHATLAGGVHFIHVGDRDPRLAPIGSPLQMSSTAPLVAVGAGLSVRIASWLIATAEADVIVTQPLTNVRIDGSRVGQSGGPSLLGLAGLSVLVR